MLAENPYCDYYQSVRESAQPATKYTFLRSQPRSFSFTETVVFFFEAVSMRSLACVFLICIGFSASLSADTMGVVDAAWSEGSAVFDDFDNILMNGQFFSTAATTTSANVSGGTALISQTQVLAAPGGVLGGPDESVYTHSSFALFTMGFTPTTDVSFLQLQIKEVMGGGIPVSFVSGPAPLALTTNYDDGSGNAITSFYWDLHTAPVTAGNPISITVAAPPFSFDSFDSFSFDFASVPEPSALGACLLGLGAVLRRRRK